MARQLTLRQRRFAEALPFAHSAKEAAIIAGYPLGHSAESRASENVRKREIMEAAEQAIQSAADKAGVSPLWALERLKEHREAAAAVKQFGPANHAVELIGKHLRMWGDERDSRAREGDTYNQVVLQGFTLEQLRALIEQMRGLDSPASSKEGRE